MKYQVSDFGLSRSVESQYYKANSSAPIPVRWYVYIYVVGAYFIFLGVLIVCRTAPEALKKGNFTSASDVWSFGILCWEVRDKYSILRKQKVYAKGEVPYDWLSNKEVSEQIANGLRLSKPTICPEKVWGIVFTCWNVNPDMRPNFLKLCEELQNFAPNKGKYIEEPPTPVKQVDEPKPEANYNNIEVNYVVK